jgi:hypothetical protein
MPLLLLLLVVLPCPNIAVSAVSSTKFQDKMRPFQLFSPTMPLLLLLLVVILPCPNIVVSAVSSTNRDHYTSMDHYNVLLNAGSLEHWEHTLGPNGGIDLSHLNFYDENEAQGIETVVSQVK